MAPPEEAARGGFIRGGTGAEGGQSEESRSRLQTPRSPKHPGGLPRKTGGGSTAEGGGGPDKRKPPHPETNQAKFRQIILDIFLHFKFYILNENFS